MLSGPKGNLVTLLDLVLVPENSACCFDSVTVDHGQHVAFGNSLEEEPSEKERVSALGHPLCDLPVPFLEVADDNKDLLSAGDSDF